MKVGEKLRKSDCEHAIRNHTNLTNKNLEFRLLQKYNPENPYVWGAGDLATVFSSEEVALDCIEKVINAHQDKIKRWTNERDDYKIELEWFFQNPVGYGLAKNTDFAKTYYMYGCKVILKLGYNGALFDVVTAFPIPNPAIRAQIKRDRDAFLLERASRFGKRKKTS